MKIYTRTGDNGTTALRDGRRVRKDSPPIEAQGALDELTSAIGLARSLCPNRRLDHILTDIQNDLSVLSAALAGGPEQSRNMARRVAALEQLIDELSAELPPLRQFILPTGALHLARAICRRAERVCAMMPSATPYLNRLGDLLFVLARWEEMKLSLRRESRRTARRAR